MRKTLVLSWISLSLVAMAASASAGGYELTDSDGSIIQDKVDKTIRLGPEDKVIILSDFNKNKVFELTWDAEKKSIVVKGDNVHVRVFSNGEIEKWSSVEQREENAPILIQPVIPVMPRR